MRAILPFLLLSVMILLAGCGGGESVSQATGRAVFSFEWPATSRLIPLASSSIRVEIRNGATAMASEVLSRPVGGGPASVTFNALPVGNLTAVATAYPQLDGTGVAQATASTPLTIQAGRDTAFQLTMASTIEHLEIAPATPSLGVGESLALTVTAKDAANRVVLMASSRLQWGTSNGAVATVDATGRVTGVTEDAVQITVTETESGKSVTANVNVVDAPVSWWKAEGNGQDAVGGNHATVSAGVTYGAGRTGQAFVFDGNSGALRVSDANNLKITDSLTIDVWINVLSVPSPANNYGMILLRGDNRGGFDPYFLGMQSDGRIHFACDSVTNQRAEISVPIALGRWVHVTAILDGTQGVLELYLDGLLTASLNTALRPLRDLDTTTNPGIGIGNSQDPAAYHYPFHGSIDELKIYNRVVPP